MTFSDVCGVEGKDNHGAMTGEGLSFFSHGGQPRYVLAGVIAI